MPYYYLEGGTISVGVRKRFDSYYEYDADAIEHSNRPFVDDREPWEKTIYEHKKAEIQMKLGNYSEAICIIKNAINSNLPNMQADRHYYDFEKTLNEYMERQIYNEFILKQFPDIAPKSFSGYMRMKSTKSKNYLKLVEAAKECGFNINDSEKTPDRNTDSNKESFVIDKPKLNLYEAALEVVQMAGFATVSLLQSRLNIDKQQANNLLNELEQNGVVGATNGNLPRPIL